MATLRRKARWDVHKADKSCCGGNLVFVRRDGKFDIWMDTGAFTGGLPFLVVSEGGESEWREKWSARR